MPLEPLDASEASNVRGLKHEFCDTIDSRLKFVEQRIKTHISRRELDAAAILSSEMIALAEGKLTEATSPEFLPTGKTGVHRLTRKQRATVTLATVLCTLLFIPLACHNHFLGSLFQHFMDNGKCAEARLVVQLDLSIASLFRTSEVDAECALVETYLCDGQFKNAQDEASKLLQRHPNSGWGLSLMALTQWHQHHLADAEQSFTQALEYQDERWNSRVGDLACIQFAQGHVADARQTLRLLNLKEWVWGIAAADYELINGNYRHSCELFEQALAKDMQHKNRYDEYWNVRQLNLYAQALAGAGDFRKSQMMKQQALDTIKKYSLNSSELR